MRTTWDERSDRKIFQVRKIAKIADDVHPRKAIVLVDQSTEHIVPVSIIKKVEARKGAFNGYAAYGEPFPLPREEALLLQTKPIYSCLAKYGEMGELYWLSYNKEVTRTVLDPICSRQSEPSEDETEKLTVKGKVFAVSFGDE